jgi:cellobiose transport system substrate-binding protein
MGSRASSPRRRRRAIITALVTLGLITVGFAATTAVGKSHDDVTLRVSLFGDFGYHDLYKQFEASHPGVTIKEEIQAYPDHHANLAKHLATGAGAADIEAIEVGFIAQFKAQPQKFYDLNQYGAAALKNRWLAWKWQSSLAPNGAQIGLGTDVGSLAICYRRDLFAKAGLPSQRDAVSKLWPTWAAFNATGLKFKAKAPKGVSFYDSGSNVYNAIIAQLNPAYYDASGKVIVDTNPKLKQAWALATQGVTSGLSAGLAAFSTEWNTGYKKGTFATVTCPAWMMGYIQGQAPATKGKWDVAAVPGSGGSWGGSYLAIPKQSKNAEVSYELVKFLTSPASEAYVFKQTGNLPSIPSLYNTPAIANFKNPFFNNAPVGKIFTTSAKRLKPQITGPHQGDFQTAVSQAIQRVEQKKQTPDQSWKQFLKDAKAFS